MQTVILKVWQFYSATLGGLGEFICKCIRLDFCFQALHGQICITFIESMLRHCRFFWWKIYMLYTIATVPFTTQADTTKICNVRSQRLHFHFWWEDDYCGCIRESYWFGFINEVIRYSDLFVQVPLIHAILNFNNAAAMEGEDVWQDFPIQLGELLGSAEEHMQLVVEMLAKIRLHYHGIVRMFFATLPFPQRCLIIKQFMREHLVQHAKTFYFAVGFFVCILFFTLIGWGTHFRVALIVFNLVCMSLFCASFLYENGLPERTPMTWQLYLRLVITVCVAVLFYWISPWLLVCASLFSTILFIISETLITIFLRFYQPKEPSITIGL